MSDKPFALALRTTICAGLFVSGLAAAQQVTIARDSTLHAEPKADAAAVAQLKQGASAEVIGRQGAWVNVKTGSGTGWMYSFNVSYGAGGAPAAPAATTQRKPATSTIGIRGLEKEDLKNATFDANQLDALDSFATGAEGAPKGARKK